MAQMMMSSFVLGYGIGPLFFAPLSEIYGRMRILQVSSLVYLAFNTACAVAGSSGTLIALRIMAGIAGSSPHVIGTGVVGDLWRVKQRGKAMAVYTLLPTIAPALGPVIGGVFVENKFWRWSFYSLSITDAVIQILGFLVLRETHSPTIIQLKATLLRKDTKNPDLRTVYDGPKVLTPLKRARIAFLMPFRLMFTQPIIIVASVFMCVFSGALFLLLASFHVVWEEQYSERMVPGTLNYLFIAAGSAVGALYSALCQDRIYRYISERRSGMGRPEFRLPAVFMSAILCPTGFMLYGLASDRIWHPSLTNAGAALFGFGTTIGLQAIQVYLVDSYPRYAASAIAAATLLRSFGGFGFPILAPNLFATQGYGRGGTYVASGLIFIGLLVAGFLQFKGRNLRQNSKYAWVGDFAAREKLPA